MHHLRRLLLLFLLVPSVFARAQSTGAGFAVTTTGDTILLRKSAWIAVDRHPQVLVYKDAAGQKHKEPASNFSVVHVPSAAAAFAREGGAHFVTRAIPTRDGNCWHFVQELHRSGSARIYRSVHCSRCQTLRIYVQQGDGVMVLLGEHNWKSILPQHFSQSAAILEALQKQKYDVVRIEKLLWEARG